MKCFVCEKEIIVKNPIEGDNVICVECYKKDPNYLIYGKINMVGEVIMGEKDE